MNGKQVRMARCGLKLSAQELADRAGVGRMTVVRIEADRNVEADALDRVALALKNAGAQFSNRGGRVSVSVPE